MKLRYKFSYGNFFKFLFTQIIIICYHFLIILCLGFLNFIIFGSDMFENSQLTSAIVKTLSIAITLLWLIYLIVILFLPKRVVLHTDTDFVFIKRYFLNYDYFSRGFNDKIDLKDVIECKEYEGKRFKLDRTEPYAVFFFDWDDLVEIKTESKTYYVPIKNSKEFIAEINSRIEKINFFKKLNIDDLLLTKDGKKLSYNDLYVRWKESKIDGVYYVNENGEKVDLISY